MVKPSRIVCLPQVDSTNTWCKQKISELQHGDAVYTTCQTAGRGRLGRSWNNAPNRALYYSIVLKCDMKEKASLPLAVSLIVAQVLQQQFGVTCKVKWPNDLICGSKKVAGILCEAVPEGIVCGVGINLVQTQQEFLQSELPHATSIACELGEVVDMKTVPNALADALTQAFCNQLTLFYEKGFSVIRQTYKERCVNLQRQVFFEGGQGIAQDIDASGCLVVQTETGNQAIFTGEVSVKGIYNTL